MTLLTRIDPHSDLERLVFRGLVPTDALSNASMLEGFMFGLVVMLVFLVVLIIGAIFLMSNTADI